MTPLEQELLDLLKIDSPTGKEEKIALHIHRQLADCPHLELTQYGLSQIYQGPLDPGKKTLALYGHIDTIIAEFAPPRVEEEKIYGLGASDMKGGVAAMMQLLRSLEPAKAKYNLICVFYDKEEGPYLENGLGPVLEQHPGLHKSDLALALEPTDNQIQAGCLGGLHAKVRFTGRAAHSARPWQGDNALYKAWPLLQRLSQMKRVRIEQGGLEFFEVIHATQAQTTNMRNSIPGQFELNLNYRFAPGKPLEQAKKELEEIVGPGPEIEFVDECPSAAAFTENPLLEELRKGYNLSIEAKQAWTDVGRLGQYGIEAANFGPGQSSQAHQKNEWIDRASLAEHYEILQGFLYKL